MPRRKIGSAATVSKAKGRLTLRRSTRTAVARGAPRAPARKDKALASNLHETARKLPQSGIQTVGANAVADEADRAEQAEQADRADAQQPEAPQAERAETVLTITKDTPIIRSVGGKASNTGATRYWFADHLLYSHLDFPTFRKKIEGMGWSETRDPKKAHMILSSYWKYLLRWVQDPKMQGARGKRLVLWTHEPYHDWHEKLIEPIGTNPRNEVRVLNCYTRALNNGRNGHPLVFCDNFRYFRWGEMDQLLQLSATPRAGYRHCPREAFEKGRFPALALSTKYDKSYYQGNRRTLLPRRYEIIETGLKHRPQPRARVWGRNWGKLAAGNSRGDANREQSKAEILASGYFNIALENTVTPYYVTEKLWEAIANYCLPVYWSNSTIYERGCMPQDSFVDARLIYEKWGRARGAEKVWETLARMSHEEYLTRMNRCIRAFNAIARRNLQRGFLRDSQNHHLHTVDYSRNWQHFRKLFL